MRGLAVDGGNNRATVPSSGDAKEKADVFTTIN